MRRPPLPPPSKHVDIKQENNVAIQKPAPIIEKKYTIEKEMATLTMAQVLITQRHYQEALAVLGVLESSGQHNGQLAKQKDELLELISKSQK